MATVLEYFERYISVPQTGDKYCTATWDNDEWKKYTLAGDALKALAEEDDPEWIANRLIETACLPVLFLENSPVFTLTHKPAWITDETLRNLEQAGFAKCYASIDPALSNDRWLIFHKKMENVSNG